MDITLILDDHHEQRRLFAILDELDRFVTASLAVIWKRLAAFLDVHAYAEERLFYPMLMRLGRGAGGKADAGAETLDAIGNHLEIRDLVVAVAGDPVGGDGWYAAVAKADEVNSDHMGGEKRQGLTDVRTHAPLQLRHDPGVAFAVFDAANVDGVAAVDLDPQAYVGDHANPEPSSRP